MSNEHVNNIPQYRHEPRVAFVPKVWTLTRAEAEALFFRRRAAELRALYVGRLRDRAEQFAARLAAI
jgi:hypothetical protein